MVADLYRRMEWGLLSNTTTASPGVGDGVGCLGDVGLRCQVPQPMVPDSMGRIHVWAPDHGEGTPSHHCGWRLVGCRVGRAPYLGRAPYRCYCDNQAVVACLRSKTSRHKGLMHLLCTLVFVEAHFGFQFYPVYVETHTNHLADDLSRNNCSSFLSKVSHARLDPSLVPPPLLHLLLDPRADWVSPLWRRRFSGIFSRVLPNPPYLEDIWCSIETLPWFLYAVCCPFAISSLGTAAMLLCSISSRPGSGAADRQVAPLCNPQYAYIPGSPRPSRLIVSASVEAGASRYQSG